MNLVIAGRKRSRSEANAGRAAALDWRDVTDLQCELFEQVTRHERTAHWHDYVDALRLFLDGYLTRTEFGEVLSRCLRPEDYALHNRLLLAMLRVYQAEEKLKKKASGQLKPLGAKASLKPPTAKAPAPGGIVASTTSPAPPVVVASESAAAAVKATAPPAEKAGATAGAASGVAVKVEDDEEEDGARRDAAQCEPLVTLEELSSRSALVHPIEKHYARSNGVNGVKVEEVAGAPGAGAPRVPKKRRRTRLPGYEVLDMLFADEQTKMTTAGVRLMIVACQERAKELLRASVDSRNLDPFARKADEAKQNAAGARTDPAGGGAAAGAEHKSTPKANGNGSTGATTAETTGATTGTSQKGPGIATPSGGDKGGGVHKVGGGVAVGKQTTGGKPSSAAGAGTANGTSAMGKPGAGKPVTPQQSTAKPGAGGASKPPSAATGIAGAKSKCGDERPKKGIGVHHVMHGLICESMLRGNSTARIDIASLLRSLGEHH
mmetsp:Transcript_6394/g.17987  ORF Transcript_6394/g.17987 Transcript_6394/m.17987 type:complete len:492 (-) Transcript_6394:1326-2801(-)